MVHKEDLGGLKKTDTTQYSMTWIQMHRCRSTDLWTTPPTPGPPTEGGWLGPAPWVMVSNQKQPQWV